MLILLLAAQTALLEPAPEPAVDQDIIVVARKLERWKGRFSQRGNVTKCKTTVSSGDKEIDAVGCDALRLCLSPMMPRIQASDDKSLGKERQIALKKVIGDELVACAKATRADMVAELVLKRRSGK